ncbi:rhodanese-like domain-containing protein [Vagococcus jeotgali]|uniref:rhodanese-like domain-containing protein n=1 Tax=Vagococcus jeotgali TaxID=3109030 RepID=UPI002DDAB0C9|nr:rhodanese-like domain-containing protein [Vagococcus sp. B2T-5]
MFLFKKVPSINQTELQAKLKGPIELIDVRSPEEYAQGHIAKAKNIPMERIKSYKGKGKPVYLICASGARSKRAAQQLIAEGIEAYNIDGGMMQFMGPVKVGKK